MTDSLSIVAADLRAAGQLNTDLEARALSALSRATPLVGPTPAAYIEVVARLLEARPQLRDRPLFASLIRESGLFPYVSADADLDAADRVAVAAHTVRSAIGSRKIVMHREQANAYGRADAGQDLALSAPTSFGKTAIAHELIRSNRYGNVLFVVPTLALLDETRRALADCQSQFRLITHPGQVLAERNLMVLTPERALEIVREVSFDLVVVDEFYTLDDARRRRLQGKHDERSTTLNALYARVAASSAQIVMLGPSVAALADGVSDRLKRSFVRATAPTVHLELNRLDDPGARKRPRAAAELAVRLSEPTLLYCSGPARSETVARELVREREHVGDLDGSVEEAAIWLSKNYGDDWIVPVALRSGIGIHHGALSRGVARFMVRAFNDGRLDRLVCTSTLLQGVNTAAKNVIVVDQKMGTDDIFDSFAFANIAGRAGRMGRYFVGHVFHFGSIPQESERVVDVPVSSQGPDTPDELVVEGSGGTEATQTDRERSLLEELEDAGLDADTVRRNIGVPLTQQIALAEQFAAMPAERLSTFSWSTATPNTKQIRATTDLLWEAFSSPPTADFFAIKPFISSAAQLRLRMMQLDALGPGRGFFNTVFQDQAGFAESRGKPAPDLGGVIRQVNKFMRDICGYKIPSRLRAVEAIVAPFLERHGLPPADYSAYAATIENLYLGVAVSALDELGIPPQLIAKLRPQLAGAQTADSSYGVVRGLDLAKLDLSPFERDVLKDAIDGLGGGQTALNL